METLGRPSIPVLGNLKSLAIQTHLLNIQLYVVVIGRPRTKHTIKSHTNKITPFFLFGRITNLGNNICGSISLHNHVHKARLLVINNELHLTEWHITHSRKLTRGYLTIIGRWESFITFVNTSPLTFTTSII